VRIEQGFRGILGNAEPGFIGFKGLMGEPTSMQVLLFLYQLTLTTNHLSFSFRIPSLPLSKV
jgi:hypothetical protein